MNRMDITESRVWRMKTGFHSLPVEHRRMALRHKEHDKLVKQEAMRYDCLSWALFSKPAYTCGKKIMEKNKLNCLRMSPKPHLP
jgi:hypothetical protein